MSFSVTRSDSFTIINARKLASKVATDMHLCAQYYGLPSETSVREYAEELAQYLNAGYLSEYEFGYKKDGKRIVTWRYKVDANGQLTTDDRPGKIVPYVDIAGATFYNFLTRNARFAQLSADGQDSFKASLPVHRPDGQPPSDGAGYWTSDRNYYSGGCGLNRLTFQPVA
ncbi:MAG TPA: hypothetical protein VGG45_10305 [Terracidiphilus sp.]|jgi:hypothetical protein